MTFNKSWQTERGVCHGLYTATYYGKTSLNEKYICTLLSPNQYLKNPECLKVKLSYMHVASRLSQLYIYISRVTMTGREDF